MNFTIRVFTLGLINDDNMCKKFCPIRSIIQKVEIISISNLKRKAMDLMPAKPKTFLSKLSKEHRIRFGSNHIM